MSLKDQIISFFVTYGFRVLGGLLILGFGVFISGVVGNFVRKALLRFHLEPPVESLFVKLARLLVIVLATVLAVSQFGVNITPLVAGIGVIGVGIGLATQGVLSNMMAGLLIIFTKPFLVGEYIELLGVDGIVNTIGLFSTRLQHFDKSIVHIPNRKIVGEILHNYGTTRQIELTIGVGYNSSLDQTESILRQALSSNARVLKEPAPLFGVNSLDDSNIIWKVRAWVKVPDFVAAPGELYSAIIENLNSAGIEMAFPQREIRILSDETAGIKQRMTAGI